MHDTKKHAAVVDRLKGWARAAALGNSLLIVALVYPCVAGIAEAAACPPNITGNLPAYIALGAGSCTLPDGSTLSNFRYSTSTVGSATVPPPSVTGISTGSSPSLSIEEDSFFPATTPGTGNSLTFNFGYKLTAASGTLFGAASQVITAYGGNSVDLETVNESLCIGGTFSSIPPGSCSGTLVNLPTLSASNNSGFPVAVTFAPASSVDVFSSTTAAGSVNFVGATQRFGTVVAPPPPPPPPGTPLPPSIILTLTGIGAAGLYLMRRRLTARS
jgi:hypothetical protein